jgi:hypothetical protein
MRWLSRNPRLRAKQDKRRGRYGIDQGTTKGQTKGFPHHPRSCWFVLQQRVAGLWGAGVVALYIALLPHSSWYINFASADPSNWEMILAMVRFQFSPFSSPFHNSRFIFVVGFQPSQPVPQFVLGKGRRTELRSHASLFRRSPFQPDQYLRTQNLQTSASALSSSLDWTERRRPRHRLKRVLLPLYHNRLSALILYVFSRAHMRN